MNHCISRWLLLGLLSFGAQAQTEPQPPEAVVPGEPPACLAKRTDALFAPYVEQREAWERQYKRRRAEFHSRMMEHAAEIERCVEHALRRDMGSTSRTTFGVHVGPDGRLAQVAVLESNHADNLYGNCLVRTLCKIELSPGAAAQPEVFVFDFNMRRKLNPQYRPWSLDPRHMP